MSTKTKKKPNLSTDTTNGARVIWWQRGLYTYAFTLCGASIFLNVATWVQGGFSRVFLFVMLLILGMTRIVLGTIKGGFVEPQGLNVTETEPNLTAFVRRVAREVNAPEPAEVYLIAEAELYAQEASYYFGLKTDKTVAVIGMPYLQVMTRRELATAIGHQLAHFAENHIAHGARAYRGLHFASRLIAVERENIVNGVFGSYGHKMFRSVGGVGVAQEQAADRAVADLYGTAALRSALAKIDDVASAFDDLLRDYVVPALQQGFHPRDMYDGFAQLVGSPTRTDARADDVARRRAAVRTEFDLHRTAGDRTALVSEWPDVPGTSDVATTPAIDLLDARGNSAESVVAAWAERLVQQPTTPQTWDELATEVFSLPIHETARLGFGDDEFDPAENFATALEWSRAGDWSEVEPHLEKPFKKIDDPQERLEEWARCVVLEAAAAQPGFRWKHHWDGAPHLIDITGARFDPAPIAELLVAGKAEDADDAFAEEVTL